MSEAWLLSSICQEFYAVELGCKTEVRWQGCENQTGPSPPGKQEQGREMMEETWQNP